MSPPRHLYAARAPPPGCVIPAAPLAARGRSRGAGRPSSHPPSHLQAPRLPPGSPVRTSATRRGAGPEPHLPGRLHNHWGWGQGSPPDSRPHTCLRDVLPGRGQRPSATAGARKVSLCGAGLLTSERCGEMEAEQRGCASRAAFPLPRGGPVPGFLSRSPAESPAPGLETAAGHPGLSAFTLASPGPWIAAIWGWLSLPISPLS